LRAAVLLGLSAGVCAAEPHAILRGVAVLPADTFAPGPPSGQFDAQGRRAAVPRFRAQPVQGISSVAATADGTLFWALSDNGFGSKWNSPDFRLVIHQLQVRPDGARDARVRIVERIELRDPAGHFSWRLAEEAVPGRPLTGADLDPESMVVQPDGSFWIGDEFGPWLLHFSRRGELLSAPVAVRVPGLGELRSPQHPQVLAGSSGPNLKGSSGIEGLAASADGRFLYAMLEGSLDVAAEDAGTRRIIEFDPTRREFTGWQWRYPVSAPTHAIGELTHWRGSEFLVIERDNLQGDTAQFKRIYSVDLGHAATAGLLEKRLRVDLLAIDDPDRVAGPGPFRYPYLTIEALAPLGADSLLIVNDNNYPARGGRGADVPDATEWIWLQLR